MNKVRRVTLHTIAKQVGVSATTISRVLSGQAARYRISKSTEETVLQAAAELGYLPDQLARGLRIKRTHTIGLIIPDISNPFFSTLARNIEIEARKAGYSIILSDIQEETQLEVESTRLLQSRKVEGLIICPAGEQSEHLKAILRIELPMVIVDRHFPELECPYVVSDNYKGSFEAVSYFIENNHRIIAFIQGRLHTSVNNDRVRGYRDALKKHNIPFDEAFIVGDSFGERNGYVGAKMLLNRASRPTAIIAASNLISLGAMRAIYEEGLKIPDEISMISFDDQPYSDYLATPMTTVAQQTTEMGQIAFKLLMSQINLERPRDTEGVVLSTELKIRKSVKKLEPAFMKETKEETFIGA
ncbi:MAG: LacI family transcriptional regulator [Planctomycetes bacterium]|nr:LacI family transcriptional regulator [Planctomycetota bacterium]